MTNALFYATAASLILAVVSAVARDVPLLNLIAPPELESELLTGLPWLILLTLFALGYGMVEGTVGPRLFVATWLGGLAYFWWNVAWHLWHRR